VWESRSEESRDGITLASTVVVVMRACNTPIVAARTKREAGGDGGGDDDGDGNVDCGGRAEGSLIVLILSMVVTQKNSFPYSVTSM
jgi:hypothetical protein